MSTSPFWVATGAGAGPASGVMTVPVPAGVQAGDMLIVIAESTQAAGTITPPSGWALKGGYDQGSSIFQAEIEVYEKIATSSEPASYTFTISGGDGTGGAIMYAARGDGTALSIQNVAVTHNDTASTSFVMPGLPSGDPNILVVWAYCNKGINNPEQTYTLPGGLTQRAHYRNGGSGYTMEIDDMPQAAAGATPSKTITASTADQYTAVVFSITQASNSGGGGVTNPTLGTPTVSNITSTTATGSVTTDTGSGTLYWKVSANSTETAATVEAASAQTVTATGAQTINITGLTAGTNGLYLHCVQTTVGGGVSTEVNSTAFNTPAAPTNNASFACDAMVNNTNTGVWANQVVYWVWQQGGRIGSAPTSSTYGTGTIDANGNLTLTGLPAGAGYGMVAKRNTSATDDNVFYQAGTAA